MNNNIKSILIVLGLIVAVTVMIGGLWFISQPAKVKTNLVPFAQCLTSKKFTMYGAVWCSHCAAQKALFGSAFEEVPYVECPEKTALCEAKKVIGYPTWLFPDGKGGEKRLEGEQTLETLAKESECVLPAETSTQ